MSENRIYLESTVLGDLARRLSITPSIRVQTKGIPIILETGETSILEIVSFRYDGIGDDAGKLLRAVMGSWADLTNNHKSLIKWGSDAQSYVPIFMRDYKAAITAGMFVYWDEGDPGSMTELMNPTITFTCYPGMNLQGHLGMTVTGISRPAQDSYEIINEQYEAWKKEMGGVL